MDYIYNYAFLWISLITRTKRFFTVTKKKKKTHASLRSYKGMSSNRKGEKKKKKRNDHHRL